MNNLNTAFIALILAFCLAPFDADAKSNGRPDKVDVIVGYDAKPGKAENDRVKGLGGETRREFDNFNMRVISISENALKQRHGRPPDNRPPARRMPSRWTRPSASQYWTPA
jgi:hypothetical protein